MHWTRSDAVGEGPGDFGWFARVARVEPVDVPVLFEGEDQAYLKGSARGDAWRERDEFSGEVLGLDGAGAAVADDLKLSVRGDVKEEGAGEEQEFGDSAVNIHLFQL